MEAKRQKRSWPPDLINEVLTDIRDNGISHTEASKKYEIPRSTIVEKMLGTSSIDAKNGRPPLLSDEEENTVHDYAEYRAKAGHPISKITVMAMAAAVHARFSDSTNTAPKFDIRKGPSNKWWLSFKKRRGLTLRKPDALDRGRKDSVDEEVVSDFFGLYIGELKANGLENKPHRIYNADETGFTLDPQKKKIVTCKSLNGYCSSVRPGGREHITVMECASADGTAIPPLTIFPKNFPSSSYKLDGPINGLYATSESGYIDKEIYLHWLKKCFHKYASQERPVLLIQDQHSTHINAEVIEFAIDNGIIMLGLPPHASHFLQPMDARGGPFLSLKNKFADVVHSLCVARPNFYVSKSSFPKIYNTARDQALTMATVKRGFKNTGIFPVNQSCIDKKWLEMNDVPVASVEAKTNDTVNEPCKTCGCTKPQANPLVAAGIIPEYMQDILTPVRPSQARIKKRIKPKAIVFDEEYIETLKEEAEKVEKEKEQKKKERQEKKRKREEEVEKEKEQKKKEREEKKRKREEKVKQEEQRKREREEKKRKREEEVEKEKEQKKKEREEKKRKREENEAVTKSVAEPNDVRTCLS
ncbi:uncharacterized protein [Branchiostoma lanceolatum]|uniref:uncharacterized protein n=1 Tax=Branchiostoma lanceolatum TaxID=7740 RepID=UPI00345415F2